MMMVTFLGKRKGKENKGRDGMRRDGMRRDGMRRDGKYERGIDCKRLLQLTGLLAASHHSIWLASVFRGTSRAVAAALLLLK